MAIPNCQQEIYNIQTSSSGSAANNNYAINFNTPLKDIARAELVTASIPCSTSNVVYVSVDQLRSKFNDFSNAAAGTLGNAVSSPIRNVFGSVYNDDTGTKDRITYYNRYPIVAEFPYPIQRLEKLNIKLYDNNGLLLQDEGENYFTFRFICNRKNLC